MIYRIALLLGIFSFTLPLMASNPWDPRKHRQENVDENTLFDHESLSENTLTQEEPSPEEHEDNE